MATTAASFAVLSLEDAGETGDDGRARIRLRRDLDLGAFGASAVRQAKAGERLIGEHVDAPQGTVVFVRDPASKRAAVATEDGTTVLAVGGRRGEAYRATPGATIAPFFPLYTDKDYEGALAVCHAMLEQYPGN